MNAPVTSLVVGASRGIGLALVRQLLRDPFAKRVYATFRNPASAAGLLDIGDPRLVTAEADVTDESSLEKLALTVRAKADTPDLVINAAGILHEGEMQPEKSLGQCRGESLKRSFEVNAIGPLLVAKAVVPLMPRRQPAHLAVLSAMVGSIGDNRLGGWYGYRASKSALNQFMRTLSVECRRTHPALCITAIHPGTTNTGLSAPFQANVEPEKLYTPEQSAARILDVVMAGRPENSGRFMNWDGSPIPW